MLRVLSYISVIFYMLIIYGQNIFEFGSVDRAEFYFIGMAISRLLLALTIYKAFKNIATSFLLFMCIGEVINEIYLHGAVTCLEIGLGCLGIIYILTEKYIIKLWK